MIDRVARGTEVLCSSIASLVYEICLIPEVPARLRGAHGPSSEKYNLEHHSKKDDSQLTSDNPGRQAKELPSRA